MGDDVNATLVATGAVEAIAAGVGIFRQRFAKCAEIRVDGEGTPPSRGRHRA
jgi:hypothetical protein